MNQQRIGRQTQVRQAGSYHDEKVTNSSFLQMAYEVVGKIM